MQKIVYVRACTYPTVDQWAGLETSPLWDKWHASNETYASYGAGDCSALVMLLRASLQILLPEYVACLS